MFGKRQRKALSAGRTSSNCRPSSGTACGIALKKLRYATEFFEALYPKSTPKPYLAALKDLQDGLGHLNDVAVAQRLIDSLVGRGDRSANGDGLQRAAGLVLGWHARGVADRRRQSWAPGRNSPGASHSGAEAKGQPPMMVVLVANTKGGCGKTTVATNLAAALASHGQRTALADADRQRSSLEWARLRPGTAPITATRLVEERPTRRRASIAWSSMRPPR